VICVKCSSNILLNARGLLHLLVAVYDFLTLPVFKERVKQKPAQIRAIRHHVIDVFLTCYHLKNLPYMTVFKLPAIIK